MPNRFEKAFQLFDAANGEDPNRETAGGAEHPKELLYARRMTERLDRFAPDASEALKLAARAQHICRWMIPRGDYPMDRVGYHRWRTALSKLHAEKAGKILREVGYDGSTIERVQTLILKRNLKDPEVQTLEDVVDLVFLEHYFSDFAGKHDEEKLIGIIQKTWKKMSSRGREAALELDLPAADRALIEKALGAGGE